MFYCVLLSAARSNPRCSRSTMSVFAPELTDRLASVLQELGSERAWVVHAEDGLDELSTIGLTRISELRDGEVHTWRLDPKDVGIPYARLSELRVNNVDEAARALRSVLAGDEGPMREIALLNAAAALVVAGAAQDLSAALGRAAKAVDSGKAQGTLQALIDASQRAKAP